jgi:hypothetical protein
MCERYLIPSGETLLNHDVAHVSAPKCRTTVESFENMEEFTNLGTAVADQNVFQERN